MKKLKLNNINRFKIGKKWQIFSVFVFFTTILWFLNALNQEYSTDIKVPVHFYNLPQNKANIADLPKNFTATVKAYGYNILKFQLKKNFTPLRIDLSDVQFFRLFNNDTNQYYVLTDNYSDYIENMLQSNMQIEMLKPDSIFFHFTTYKEKYVPVVIDANISVATQFVLKSPPSVTPDSVLIGGPAISIDTIEQLYTKNFSLNNVKTISQKTIDLQEIDGVTTTPQNVNVTVDVEEYTELRFKVQIESTNVPDSVDLLLFPNYVNVVCKVGVDNSNNISGNDFKVIVDYNSIFTNMGTELSTEIIEAPTNVYEYYQTPEFVEYIIEKND